MSTEIWRYAYVRRPYHQVVQRLAEAPRHVLGADAEGTGDGLAHLFATVAGVAVSKAARLEAGTVQAEGEWATLPIRWEAAEHAGLFPTMEATLEVAPVAEGDQPLTQVGLVGHYRLPFGVAGQAGDALGGRRVVEESVEGFLDELVRRLEAELAVVPQSPEDAAGPGPPAGQRRKVKIVLPGMRARRGGLLAVRRRLAATPGTTLIRIHPGLAEVAYDPDLIGLRAILALFEEDGSEAQEPAQSGEKVS